MEKTEFAYLRRSLGKTQKQLAQLLGTSIKAVHSYEQGWRSIPAHVERQLFFLVYQRLAKDKAQKPCWTIKQCPVERRNSCPAWEFNTHNLCWFISGTICEGSPQKTWKEKMKICRACDVFKAFMGSTRHE